MTIQNWVRMELWDQVPTNIAVIDGEFKIVRVNRSFDYHYGQWQGRRCYQVYKGRTDPCEHCAARATFVDG
jgi:histidine kinase